MNTCFNLLQNGLVLEFLVKTSRIEIKINKTQLKPK